MKKPELLVPAGSLDRLKTAFLYGADVVYCGTPSMSLRSRSKFTLDEVIEGIEYAHERDKKVYLTMNLIAHNEDIRKLPEYVEIIKEANPDGVIVADPAIFEYIHRELPNMNLHVSVQANVTSWMGVKFWENMGAKMCILSRELSFEELYEIRTKCPDIRLETFAHGSMCMSYSGRCLLSNYFTGRGANQGKCAHSCRWNYKVHLKLKDNIKKEFLLDTNTRELFDFLLKEETRPTELLEVEEYENGTFLMNSKDLCLLPKLPKFMQIGIDCLKIEGRNKTQYYAGMVARIYRKAIDDCYENPENWDYKKYVNELYSISNRGYSLAFANNNLTSLANNYDITKSLSEWEFAGYIKSYGEDYVNMEVKNRLDGGNILEIISPTNQQVYRLILNDFILAQNDEIVETVHAGQEQTIKIPLENFETIEGIKKEQVIALFPPLTLIRKKNNTLNEEQKARIEKDKIDFEKEINNEI
ncbi:MAG: U32 family peptidase C-terminal domain-containing protein [Rickettsiales bacterium]|jgi:putative protease|nr:U32 family peptidase C-terminal domain-containing protein [Rickettsiales bacterium]